MNKENQRHCTVVTNTVRAAFIVAVLATLPTAGTALAATAAPDDDCIAGSCGLPHWEEPRHGPLNEDMQ